jgi:hypothetical protein
MINNLIGHHPDHHRLPLHHFQAGDHPHLGCLQHLVRIQMQFTMDRTPELDADNVTYSAVPSPPVYPNGTAPAVHTTPVGTGGGSVPTHATTTGSTPETTAPIVTAGAGKAAALSGAGLAGVLGLAAFYL